MLFGRVCHPVAASQTAGAWYRQWRLVAVDGTTFDVPDTEATTVPVPSRLIWSAVRAVICSLGHEWWLLSQTIWSSTAAPTFEVPDLIALNYARPI